MAKIIRPACVSLLFLAACLLLAGCGNKGDLVRPPPMVEEALEDDAPPAQEPPPTTEPTVPDQPPEIEPPAAGDPPSDPVTTPVSGDGDG